MNRYFLLRYREFSHKSTYKFPQFDDIYLVCCPGLCLGKSETHNFFLLFSFAQSLESLLLSFCCGREVLEHPIFPIDFSIPIWNHGVKIFYETYHWNILFLLHRRGGPSLICEKDHQSCDFRFFQPSHCRVSNNANMS